jgi:hypothetical protein
MATKKICVGFERTEIPSKGKNANQGFELFYLQIAGNNSLSSLKVS